MVLPALLIAPETFNARLLFGYCSLSYEVFLSDGFLCKFKTIKFFHWFGADWPGCPFKTTPAVP